MIILVYLQAFSVFAHGDEPRLEISAERLNPGGIVDLRGVEFDYEESATLALIGSQAEIVVAEVTANVEGEFTYIAVLPSDLAEGIYYFRATTSHHWVISPPLTVWGTAIEEGGGQGPRDEDDSLLAPMPTYAPGVVPGGVSQVEQPTPREVSASSFNSTVVVALSALAVGVLATLGLRLKAKYQPAVAVWRPYLPQPLAIANGTNPHWIRDGTRLMSRSDLKKTSMGRWCYNGSTGSIPLYPSYQEQNPARTFMVQRRDTYFPVCNMELAQRRPPCLTKLSNVSWKSNAATSGNCCARRMSSRLGLVTARAAALKRRRSASLYP